MVGGIDELCADGCDKNLFEGAYIKVKGLVNREDLNGQMGVLREWHGERGRWSVRLRSEEHVLLKEENLEVLSLFG